MKLNVALIQTNPQTDVEKNLCKVQALVEDAVAFASTRGGLDLVVLPEMFSYMGNESGRLATSCSLDSGVFAWLGDLAKKFGVFVVGGSHAEKTLGDKVFNTSVTYGPNGETISVYRKIHLFNLKDSDGNPIYCESDVFLAGSESPSFNLPFSRGLSLTCLNSICYDVRFPELYRSFNEKRRFERFDLIFLPAAFTFQTGVDHWEVLLRARAIENQCFVIAVNQTGFHSEGKKRNFGHSMVVNPWGKVLSSLNEDEGFLVCELNLNDIAEVRKKLPALADRLV